VTQVSAVLGSQWGDEGKGKLVDILAKDFDVVARCQGGANAGHTIYDDEGQKYALHLVPSGVLNKGTACVVGNGVVVHLPKFFEELDGLAEQGVDLEGRILLSDRAHVLFDVHKEVDGLREAELEGGKIGTTKRGIGPAYASKATRNGLRVCDIFTEDFPEKMERLTMDAEKRFDDLDGHLKEEVARYEGLREKLRPFVCDTVSYINESYKSGKSILIEGANATMLDLDFGTYPFVTSSNPSIGGVCAGIGLAPSKFQCIIGVVKAYTTRVGSGPYPTEIFGDLAEELRAEGYEYGTTTGRPRRIGWLDVVALNYANQINGFTHINLTKLDVLSKLPEIKVGVGYKVDGKVLTSVPSDLGTLERAEVEYITLPGWQEDISTCREWSELPLNARKYVEQIEELTGTPCTFIGVGPGRDAMIFKK